MAAHPKEWAEKLVSGATSCAELAKLRRIIDNPWTGMGRYYATRTGVAKAEIDRVFADATKHCKLAGLGRTRRRVSRRK